MASQIKLLMDMPERVSKQDSEFQIVIFEITIWMKETFFDLFKGWKGIEKDAKGIIFHKLSHNQGHPGQKLMLH